MFRQSGNFLLQALLALSLVFAFVPFLTQKIVMRNTSAQMYTATRQVENAVTAARIFVRENADNLPYETTVLTGSDFSDVLEPYGLPLGFLPRTALGQDIALIITKDATQVSAYIELTGGNLTELARAELARRIGFYASVADASVVVGVSLNDAYSDVVRRNELDLENSGFLTDLDMGGFVFGKAGDVYVRNGVFDSVQTDSLSLIGLESGRKMRNSIEKISATKSVFQSKTGEAALSIVRGELMAGRLNTRTISSYGETGNFTAVDASVYDFSMTEGRTSFNGPGLWDVRGNLVSDNIVLSVERLDVSSYINAARGQDVYVNPDDLEYSSNSGLSTDYLYVSNITMRDQTSDALLEGRTGAIVLDIRPAGTSVLPDVLVANINNDSFSIIKDVKSDDGDVIGCATLIKQLDGVYDKNSLAQNIICQYVFWQRLERRIDIKRCLMAGGSDCI